MENAPPFIIRLYQPTDFNAALAAIQAASRADSAPETISAEEFRARLGVPHDEPRLNPADDVWVAAVRETGVVAYADGWLVGADAARSYRTACFVHPDYRGRGIGRALLTRQWQRAKAIARRLSAAGAPVTVTMGARAWESQAGALAVLETGGLQRVRTNVEMQRDLHQPVPVVVAPPRLRLEPWIDARIDEALWQAYEEAFADHWGHVDESFGTFMNRMALGHVRREHSFVAWAGGAVAGGSLNDMSEANDGSQPAFIHHLFVRRAWRGRALGRALVDASLARARQLGYAAARLTVDEDNPTGARRLYQTSGFRDVARRFVYQRAYSAESDEGLSKDEVNSSPNVQNNSRGD
jgi:mycothiol synthase